MVRLLLEHGAGQIINNPDRDIQTPLSLAVRKNNIDIVRILLQHGARQSINIPDTPDLDGKTPLYWAVRKNNNIEMIQLLLEYGASFDSKTMTHPTIQEFIFYRDLLYKKYFFMKNLRSISETEGAFLQLPHQNTVKQKPNLLDFSSRQSYEDALRQYKKSLQKYVIPHFMTIKAFQVYLKEIELKEKIPEYIIRTIDRELKEDLVIKDCLQQIFLSKKKQIEDMIHEKEKDYRTFLYYLRSIGADPYTFLNGIDQLIELCQKKNYNE
jgi:hypothetical protein